MSDLAEEVTPLPEAAIEAEEEGAVEGQPEAEAEGQAEEQKEPEFVELEIDGRVYEIPVELKDGFMQHADYTRKTMEAAEARKSFESERVAFQQQQAAAQQMIQAQRENLQSYAQLAAMDAQLQQFAQIDWNAAIDADPTEAQKLQMQYRQVRDNRDQLAGYLQQQEQQKSLNDQRVMAQIVEQGRAVLQKEIEGFSPEWEKATVGYAMAQGIRPEELQQVYNPAAYKILDKARRYDALMARTQAAKPDSPKTPTTKVGKGKTQTFGPEGPKDVDAWVKWREKQLAR